MSSWAYVVLAAVLGLAAAFALRSGRYRRPVDELHHRVPVGWVPVVAVLGATAAGPFLADRAPVVLVSYVLALVWAVVLGLIDIEVRRLPDRLVLPGYPVAAVLLALCSVVTGDAPALLRAVTCAGAGVAVFLLAALVSPGGAGLGLGDVKLAGVLGALLGWLGWTEAMLGLLSGFVLGGLAAAVLLLLRRVARGASIPFGPAMLLGAYLWTVLSPLV